MADLNIYMYTFSEKERERERVTPPATHSLTVCGLPVRRWQLPRSWLMWQQLGSPTFRNAGVLLGLGVGGHLAKMAAPDIFRQSIYSTSIYIRHEWKNCQLKKKTLSLCLASHVCKLVPAGIWPASTKQRRFASCWASL